MRTSNSVRNSITALVLSLLTMLIGFISRALFIRFMDVEYLGLNGLFSNILSMLSIFELGIGSAIVYNLYKPIANNQIDEVKSLILFYKKAYNLIVCLIFIFGLILIPFLKYIVNDVSVNADIKLIYLLYLISTVCSYVIAHKRSLIYANQKNYIINLVHIVYIIVVNISQLGILYITKNFYLYLIVLILCQLAENYIISIIADKLYPFLKEKNVSHLDSKTEKNILKKVKALIFHKVGAILVLGTDNIIISSFLGVIYVGLYSNYLTIINAISTLISQIIESTIASVGNLLVSEGKEKIFDIFKKLRFLNFWLACVTGTAILIVTQPFMKIWIGPDYLLSDFVLIILVLNYYQKTMRKTHSAFKDASGTWEEDKFIPILEAGINIASSILLLKFFGLAGVFMGTIISGLCLWTYSYPKYVYKKLFDRNYMNYACETIGYIVIFIIIASITYILSIFVIVKSLLLQVVLDSLLCIIVPNLMLYIIFNKSDNFNYFKNIFIKFICKIKSR